MLPAPAGNDALQLEMAAWQPNWSNMQMRVGEKYLNIRLRQPEVSVS